MQREQLKAALNGGTVVHFDSKEEEYEFLKEVKGFGGKWASGEEITLPEKAEQLPTIFHLHVDKNFVLNKVSAMCYHFGKFRTINYKQLQIGQTEAQKQSVTQKKLQ